METKQDAPTADQLKTRVHLMAKRAGEVTGLNQSQDALNYSQAALNLAYAYQAVAEVEHWLSEESE